MAACTAVLMDWNNMAWSAAIGPADEDGFEPEPLAVDGEVVEVETVETVETVVPEDVVDTLDH